MDQAIPDRLPNPLAFSVHPKYYSPEFGGTDYGGTSDIQASLDKDYLKGVIKDIEKAGEGKSYIADIAKSQLYWNGGTLPKWKYKPE